MNDQRSTMPSRSVDAGRTAPVAVPARYPPSSASRPTTYRVLDAETETNSLRTGAAPLIVAAVMVIVVFFGGGLLWAAWAPLSRAAIASGVVTVAGNKKTIQHLEGGIVRRIFVEEGQDVRLGDILLELDQTKALSVVEPLRVQMFSALAVQAPLRAELERQDAIRFPGRLLMQKDQPVVQGILSREQDVFKSRQEMLQSQIKITDQQSLQLHEQIKGYHGQIESEQRQFDLLVTEIQGLQTLADKGLVRQPQLLALERQKAQLEGAVRHNETQIATAAQNVEELKMRVSELGNEHASEVAQSLRSVEDQLVELQESLTAAEDVLRRTVITAPIDGRIVGLKVHTVGGVIQPGEPLFEIVPEHDQLLVDARIDPKDRDVVRPGQRAEVRFTVFNQRNAVSAEARVLSVSADRLQDERSGRPYYLARIELIDDPSQALGGAKIHPGMQSEVMIIAGQRTALSYLLRPVTRSLNRALTDE